MAVLPVLRDRSQDRETPCTSQFNMDPSDDDVFRLMADYKRDFGVLLPFDDARRLLILHEEICDILQRYSLECEEEEELIFG